MRQNIALTIAVFLLAGCGMEASDTQMRTRGDMGVPEDLTYKAVPGEFVCPHPVSLSGRPFSPKEVQRGEMTEGQMPFGPFVPCGTAVPAGSGTCPSCGGQYRTDAGDENVPLAQPKFVGPFSSDPIDPVAMQVKGSADPKSPDRYFFNQDPKTKKYFETTPADVLTTVAIHEEVVSPTGVPFDPSMNSYVDKAKGEQVVRNVAAIEGVCWRCGGLGICPECSGAATGNLGLFGQAPSDCWFCFGRDAAGKDQSTGRCPDCAGSGFTTYSGGLPPGFKIGVKAGNQFNPLPSDKREWKFPEEKQGEGEAPESTGGEGEKSGG
jgi:hypothetical protein